MTKQKKQRTPRRVKNMQALNYQDAMNAEYRIHGKSERWFALRARASRTLSFGLNLD
jgi:hypothetical protein